MSNIKEATAQDKKAWINECKTSPDGPVKQASADASDYTRDILRETGITRSLFDVKSITPDQLDRSADPTRKEPFKIFEMEPASPGAAVVGFNAAPVSAQIEGNFYEVTFFDIVTREFTQNVKYLMSYHMDLREVVATNALRDMYTTEDTQFFGQIDAIVGPTPNTASAVTGIVQNVEISTPATVANRAWNREALVDALKHMANLRLPDGTAVCNAATFKNFAAMDRSEVGGDLSQDMFRDGTAALKSQTVLGQRFIASIKNDIIADDTMYLVTEPKFLGQFLELVSPTMYIEKKVDIIRFHARETIGCTIANLKGVAKIRLKISA